MLTLRRGPFKPKLKERFGFLFMNIPQISKIILKPGEYLPVTPKSSHIVAENDNIPVTILNDVAKW
jgi:hypothetical protein